MVLKFNFKRDICWLLFRKENKKKKGNIFVEKKDFFIIKGLEVVKNVNKRDSHELNWN